MIVEWWKNFVRKCNKQDAEDYMRLAADHMEIALMHVRKANAAIDKSRKKIIETEREY